VIMARVVAAMSAFISFRLVHVMVAGARAPAVVVRPAG
jgi:hypothetical protein